MYLNYEKCKEFMIEKHGSQKRKQGTPYYEHPLAVANILKEKGFGVEYQIAGLFHDLLEDTLAQEYEILALSNNEILNAVKLVTKEENFTMEEYIARIKDNSMAKMVKLADRIHNLSECENTSQEFRDKYIKETEEWFLDLAKGTCFEVDLNEVLEHVRNIK